MTGTQHPETLLVIGAGTMGHGIAQVAALSGCAVRLHDVDDARVQAGLSAMRASLDKAVSKGKLDEAGRSEAIARVTGATELESAARGATMVIEAVPEKIELKQQIFRRLDTVCDPGTVLASNTSSLSITSIASATGRPQAVAGMHFFNPVAIMPLVEVIRGDETSEATVDRVVAAAERMGKETIVVRDVAGFATSRLGIALGLEAMRMFEDGVASAEDIDRAMELGYRHPMGPLRLTDLVGLDVRLAIAEHLARELGSERFRPPEILRKMVAKGRLGKKAGRGFYDWND